jgi:alpha-tubulin suppressor-like RCC1 family protein
LFSVGCNYHGCIGDGTTEDCQIIKQIDYFQNNFISDVVCGDYHCLAISKKGEIYGWGNKVFGQIAGKDVG